MICLNKHLFPYISEVYSRSKATNPDDRVGLDQNDSDGWMNQENDDFWSRIVTLIGCSLSRR